MPGNEAPLTNRETGEVPLTNRVPSSPLTGRETPSSARALTARSLSAAGIVTVKSQGSPWTTDYRQGSGKMITARTAELSRSKLDPKLKGLLKGCHVTFGREKTSYDSEMARMTDLQATMVHFSRPRDPNVPPFRGGK
eukprot:TRINITY_DN76754_c0_g1_i1.p1 TRINITY_DN76754_c0_g1~~TRINITY_DN76754_c0_g1_i1.p1  ORF type:complete len:138 (+),score=19.49 TRINITY_DN76754_c0_g1_i1:61-474(+)